MSNAAFDQRPKDHSSNGSANNHKMEKQNIGVYNTNKQVIQNPNGAQQPVGMRATAIPESYVSGPYYQTTNTAGFPLSFPNFNQATWSTGSNNQPYEHNNFGFGTMNAAAPAPSDNQYVAPDHLFNQNNPGYNTTYSGAYLNGNNVGSWSYFNSPNSFFFPTGNADLNLSWGQQEATQTNQLLPDIYKAPMPQHHEVDGVPVVAPAVSAVDGHGQNVVNGDPSVVVDKQLSTLSISADSESPRNGDDEVHASSGASQTHVQTSNAEVSNAPSKPISWAAVAKQPAKPKPHNNSRPQQKTSSQSMSKSYPQQNGTVNGKSSGRPQQQNTGAARLGRQTQNSENGRYPDGPLIKDSSPLLKKLWAENSYNPKEYNLNFKDARVFIIKSYSEDDIFRSIKYSIWTSTEHGNRRLNEAFKEQQKNGQLPIYLLFSVNGSGHFCGIAVMKSEVDCNVETGIWVQDKWKGRFDVKWLYVKDVPNMSLRHIRLENNENKPVTNSRDTQEVPLDKAKQVLKIIHSYKAQTSIFDDFSHYEKRQLEDAKARGRDVNDADAL